MIRRPALLYIIKDTAIFPGTVIPVLPPNTQDVNLFLQTVFRHFNTDVMKNSYQYSSKKHVRSEEYVPCEAVYQHQLSAVIIRAFLGLSWYCVHEATLNKEIGGTAKGLILFCRDQG
jgi:hypothetical protein